jgi:SAM-dependent methyltransferase
VTKSGAPSCILCGGEASGPAFPYATRWRGKLFVFLECTTCRSSFVDPLPSQAELDLLFSRSAYHDVYYQSCEPRPNHLDCLAFMSKHLPQGGTLLDFGCATGAFMKAAAGQGYRCAGIERDPDVIAAARANTGLEVTTLEQALAAGARLDAIHIGDVIGHLPEPAATMRDLKALLAPGGRIVIEGPLEKQPSLVYFSAAGLKWLRLKSGRSVEGDTPPFHLSLMRWSGMTHFIERVLGWRCEAVDLVEDGWPYPADLPPQPTAGDRIRHLIAKAAIAAARNPAGRRLRLGNRFRAIIQPGDRLDRL